MKLKFIFTTSAIIAVIVSVIFFMQVSDLRVINRFGPPVSGASSDCIKLCSKLNQTLKRAITEILPLGSNGSASMLRKEYEKNFKSKVLSYLSGTQPDKYISTIANEIFNCVSYAYLNINLPKTESWKDQDKNYLLRLTDKSGALMIDNENKARAKELITMGIIDLISEFDAILSQAKS